MFYILFRLQVLFNLLIFNSYYCSFTKAFQGYLFIIKNSIIVCIWGVSCEFFFVLHTFPLEMKPYGVPRGGGGGEMLNKVLYGKAQPWGPPRYPFIYHFWLKRYPFRISSIDKWYFFNIPVVELCIFLNCCKRTFKISISHNTRTFFRLFSQP